MTAAPTLVATYSGDNSRAAILAGGHYYTVGTTAGTDTSITGAQIVTPGGAPGSNSTSLGSFTFDNKPSKDNNFRGETVFNNTLFVTKGSGSKGVDSVYQVGAAGTLPTGTGNSVTILPGFNSAAVPASGGVHPFGLFFANATTLYVADEGTGLIADFANSNNNAAGLQKWVLNTGTGQWSLQYTMRLGLNIGTNYTVSGTSGNVPGSFTTATDGLRNLTGKVNADGTVTFYAITSTASTQDGTNNSADEGTDPNKLVSYHGYPGVFDREPGVEREFHHPRKRHLRRGAAGGIVHTARRAGTVGLGDAGGRPRRGVDRVDEAGAPTRVGRCPYRFRVQGVTATAHLSSKRSAWLLKSTADGGKGNQVWRDGRLYSAAASCRLNNVVPRPGRRQKTGEPSLHPFSRWLRYGRGLPVVGRAPRLPRDGTSPAIQEPQPT